MVGESNQNVFLIQIDASSFAEFEISEFEISRVGCTYSTLTFAAGAVRSRVSMASSNFPAV